MGKRWWSRPIVVIPTRSMVAGLSHLAADSPTGFHAMEIQHWRWAPAAPFTLVSLVFQMALQRHWASAGARIRSAAPPIMELRFLFQGTRCFVLRQARSACRTSHTLLLIESILPAAQIRFIT